MKATPSLIVLAAALLTSLVSLAQAPSPTAPGPAASPGAGAPAGAPSTAPAPATGVTSPGAPGAAPTATNPAPVTPIRELAVSGVIEKDLMGPDGKAIGDIGKVVESNSNQKKYLVISSGGILGFFESQVAVPIDKVAVRNDQIVVRDLTEEQLKSLPKFDSSIYRDVGESQKVTIAETK